MKVLIRYTLTSLGIVTLLFAAALAFFVLNPFPERIRTADKAYKPASLDRHLFAWSYLNGNQETDPIIPVLMDEGSDGIEHLNPDLLNVPVFRKMKIGRLQSLVSFRACVKGGCSRTTSLGTNRICQVSANTVHQGSISMNKRVVLRHELEHCRLHLMRASSPEIDELFSVDGNEVMELNLAESYADLASLLTFQDEKLIKVTMKARKYWLKEFGDIQHISNWVLERALKDYEATGTWPVNPVTYSLNKIHDYRTFIEKRDLAGVFELFKP
ncbi:hypothetical protein SAMN04487881_0017 [Marinobacter sp. es.048]|uniref:hypothetical protein n=1 Tax=Marinobacter sp. es.048 TaxID=1761795 RepID=UPI000B588EAB|nr:hypothetical protein [Marinobacter sp. es.048]SNC59241.1 hypothetical protein SAMN04487881_0017 [Marinobacter sp. es.048]